MQSELLTSLWTWLPQLFWTAALTIPLTVGVYHVVVYVVDMRRRGRAVDLFPGNPKHWLWGHLHLFPGPNEKGLEFQREETAKFPRVFRFWAGNWVRPSICVHHPDTVKVILRTSEPKPMRLGVYAFGLPWIGEGLLISSGAKWMRNRKLLTPAFHFDVLKPYIDVKNKAAERLLDKVLPYAESGLSFEFFSNVSLLTFDIILRCAFSYENDVQIKGESDPYVQAVSELGDLWVDRTLKPWYNWDFIYYLTSEGRLFKKHCDFVHSISGDVIKTRMQTLEKYGIEAVKRDRYLDFLDILLTAKDEDGKGLTYQEIRDEVDTFLFEGHDTTASAISWALYSLAEHPDHQTLCQQEIDILGRTDDTIYWSDLAEFKYLTMCIKESMRLHVPVPFIQRETSRELTIDGITLPPRSLIDIQLYQLHHNELLWPDAMEFRPSRFLPENLSKIDNFSFLPFSAGPRNCIGQQFAMHEQKIVLARILRRYRLSLDPQFKVEKKLGIVMKTVGGMYLKISLRNDTK